MIEFSANDRSAGRFRQRPSVASRLSLEAPRYIVAVVPYERKQGSRIHGVFDTFTQEFADGDPLARTVAERAVRDANRLYEEA